MGISEACAMLLLQPGEGEMGRIGPGLLVPGVAEIVEAMHTHRIAGEAFGVATSSILKFSHSPPCPRKVPSPLSADSPAPVRMTMFRG